MKVKTQDYSKSLRGYSSQWIAIKPETTRVVASGSSPKIVIEKARKIGVNSPVLTRVPEDYGVYIL
ncbi:hypothetical protein A2188_01125 [Candidatus Woesebacteria bacterium RIFOXYA1_FULL_43_9]|uniref:DUF5678 domain-containing protein n=1 Tax=Candidatus Woesebacteria bacterium RIFOXYA1_FULL_43_9 TaxID=1802534 RepID=A0A1F8CLV4_9BACT|nr:MAG: hypothetical protein A2188_01125 [Candidatus Woesebacteria bacterium RIFOXYA1_FULL_43_9]